MNAKTFHFSFQGASHIKKNKECQDASSSYQDDECVIAIVCDGHGGDDYVRSAIGSTLGCGVAEKNIKKFMLSVNKEVFFSDPDKHLKILEASIINGWNEAISTYHKSNPFKESELNVVSEKAKKRYVEEGRIESAYGTTMIATAMNHEYWFAIHIGDGKCVAVNPEGVFKQPIPWDPKCFLNATTSICDSDAIDRFRHFYSEKLPAAVFIGSDGIDDCFSNNEQLHNLYKTMLYSFATTDFQEACDGLADYLPRLSAKGSGDDVSVAAILDLDLIPELSIVKEFDREKEKARVEEIARKEAEKNEAEKRRVEEEHAKFQQMNNAKTKKDIQSRVPNFCENCGERLRPGMNFCSNCGYRIENKNSEQGEIKLIRISPFETGPDSDKNTQTKEEIDVSESSKNPEDVISAREAIVADDEPVKVQKMIVSDNEKVEMMEVEEATHNFSAESESIECIEITSPNDKLEETSEEVSNEPSDREEVKESEDVADESYKSNEVKQDTDI